jgi:hypothetical protein
MVDQGPANIANREHQMFPVSLIAFSIADAQRALNIRIPDPAADDGSKSRLSTPGIDSGSAAAESAGIEPSYDPQQTAETVEMSKRMNANEPAAVPSSPVPRPRNKRKGIVSQALPLSPVDVSQPRKEAPPVMAESKDQEEQRKLPPKKPPALADRRGHDGSAERKLIKGTTISGKSYVLVEIVIGRCLTVSQVFVVTPFRMKMHFLLLNAFCFRILSAWIARFASFVCCH